MNSYFVKVGLFPSSCDYFFRGVVWGAHGVRGGYGTWTSQIGKVGYQRRKVGYQRRRGGYSMVIGAEERRGEARGGAGVRSEHVDGVDN